MNSAIFTRVTGTPTLRAALASPPTPKIQLPKRVRVSVHVASDGDHDPPQHRDPEVVRGPEAAAEDLVRAVVARGGVDAADRAPGS